MNIIYYKSFLWVEFMLIFFGIPLFIFYYSHIIHPSSVLLPILIALILYLRFNKNFNIRDLISFRISKKTLIENSVIIGITTIILLIGILIFKRENLFNLPRKNIIIWVIICIFYPIFSAFAQEVIYRTFLYLRYSPIFKSKWAFIIASSISFSFVHIIYFSYVSIILSFAAGIYLAYVYEKNKCVLFNSCIHGFLGDVVFTIGLGQYFWLDMYKWM